MNARVRGLVRLCDLWRGREQRRRCVETGACCCCRCRSRLTVTKNNDTVIIHTHTHKQPVQHLKNNSKNKTIIKFTMYGITIKRLLVIGHTASSRFKFQVSLFECDLSYLLRQFSSWKTETHTLPFALIIRYLNFNYSKINTRHATKNILAYFSTK